MKPSDLRVFAFMGIYLLACLFCSGCVAPQGPSMEEQLLHQCIIRGDSEGALKIINSGVMDGQIDSQSLGVTSLYLAATSNDTNVVKALLAKGANPNLTLNAKEDPDREGETPVHGAARKRSAEALKLLLEHGGSVQSRTKFSSSTPLDISVSEIEPPGPVTDMLIEAGAEVMGSGSRKADKPVHWLHYHYAGGTHWAMASYLERHGKTDASIQEYEQAATWFESASKKALGSEKWSKFMNSPVMSAMVASTALALGGGGPLTPGGPSPLTPLDPNTIQHAKSYAAQMHDKGERYAAYSKFCADRANELKDALKNNTRSDSTNDPQLHLK